MKVPAFPKSRLRPSPRHRERGVTMVLVALCMMAMIAMAALSIDVVTLYLAREEAQRSADAAALAAARIISLSGITNIGTAASSPADWQSICGNSATASAKVAAQALALQNAVAGTSPTVTIKYSAQGAAGGVTDCSALTGAAASAFAINPTVSVTVTNSSLPTLFSRIWSRAANSVNATAVAEAFNDSNVVANLGQTAVQVTPNCVKPWIIPNIDPGSGNPFVDEADGTIQSPGVRPTTATASVGEGFTLTAACTPGAPDCSNMNGNTPPAGSYVPALITVIPIAFPTSCGNDLFQQAIAGCATAAGTAYQCGIQNGGSADLTINPGGSGGDTSVATQCLINQIANGLGQGQDSLDVAGGYPYKIMSGTHYQIAALASTNTQIITASNSVVSLPIYDNAAGPLTTTQPTITILGFLQVFIDSVDTTTGNLNLHVLNVAGCGNAASTTVFAPGTSPVPIRLITSQ